MSDGEALLGPRPPQQARSRAALAKVLGAAEDVVNTDGVEQFTMQAVAARAGVSVGAIYRRFTGKDQLLGAVKDRLLGRVEQDLATALAGAGPGLESVVDAFARAVVGGLADAHLLPSLVGVGEGTYSADRVGVTLARIERSFLDAAVPYVAEVRRGDPTTSLTTIARTITGACIHRTLTIRQVPDGLSWERWTDEVADMALAYLTTPARRSRPVAP